jgi:hypothetical protein
MKSDFIVTADNTERPNQCFSGPAVTIHSKFHGLNHISYSLQNFLVLVSVSEVFLYGLFQ